MWTVFLSSVPAILNSGISLLIFVSKMATEQKVYHVLLLGETGVGKSTYLNTLLNYFTYEKMADVTDLKYFVGTRFIMMNDDFTDTTITLGKDANESNEPGQSATKRPKIYRINLPDGNLLNLIDTPGIGDTRGIEADYRNVERILEFISELEYLNAICVLFKPNNSRLGIVFDYCIKTILGQLDKEMRNNVVFLFTNGRSSFYTPGDTHAPLQKILDDMDPERVNPVPFNQYNTFCVENDWFRYLAAKQKGVKFIPKDVENFEDSWEKSSATSKRMIKYIESLPPRRLKGMLTVNEAKRLIRRLISPISNLLSSRRKDRRQLKLKNDKINNLLSNKTVLEQNLVNDVARTVQETTHIHTQETISKAHIGHTVSLLPPFYNIDLGSGKQTDVYERKNHNTVILHEKAEDPHVRAQINSNEQEVKLLEEEYKAIEKKIEEYQDEFQSLITAAAQFHVFLKENVPFYSVDQTEAYFKQKIKETENVDEDDWKMYRAILRKYNTKKVSTHSVSIKDIRETVDMLLNLKHSGSQIKQHLGMDNEKDAITE